MQLPKNLPDPDKPEQALAAAVALRQLSEKLERAAVKQAVRQGWTWNDIAEALGVTRQAAHKRHAPHIKGTKKK